MIDALIVSFVVWARARWWRWPLLLVLAVLAAVWAAALVLTPERRRSTAPVVAHLGDAADRAEAAADELAAGYENDVAAVEALARVARAHDAAETAAQACAAASGVYAYEVDLDDRLGLGDDSPLRGAR